MPDLVRLNDKKERILSLIKVKGPSLPVHIARGINESPLFSGAFLSELYREKKIKMSNMKVGSSPLYYISGQEGMLENFIEHLNVREKEAFFLLKKEIVLEDEKLNPVMRVALRAINDFAIPIRVRVDEDVKLFWKYFSIDGNSVKKMINGLISGKKNEVVISEKKGERKKENVTESKGVDIKNEQKVIDASIEKNEGKIEGKSVRKKIEENEFSKKIRDYLQGRDIEVMDVLSDKKREFIAKVRIDILFGKQEFYLMAKDKKKINDNDLIVAMQNAQNEKMPALFLSEGELHKKAIEYLRNWKNLVRFERIRL